MFFQNFVFGFKDFTNVNGVMLLGGCSEVEGGFLIVSQLWTQSGYWFFFSFQIKFSFKKIILMILDLDFY